MSEKKFSKNWSVTSKFCFPQIFSMVLVHSELKGFVHTTKIEKEVRFFLRSKMYNNKKVLLKNNEGKKIVNKLFYKIKNKPKKFLNADQLKNDSNRAIADFISGMTDRYAINLNKSI